VPSRLLIVKVTGKGQTTVAIDKIVGDSTNDSIEEAKLLLSRTPHVDEIQLLLRLQGQLMSVTAEHEVGEVLLVADRAVLGDCGDGDSVLGPGRSKSLLLVWHFIAAALIALLLLLTCRGVCGLSFYVADGSTVSGLSRGPRFYHTDPFWGLGRALQ